MLVLYGKSRALAWKRLIHHGGLAMPPATLLGTGRSRLGQNGFSEQHAMRLLPIRAGYRLKL